MKTCDKCGKALFDNEDYCVYCGAYTGTKPFQCSYCGTRIEDVKIKQCPNCAAPVVYDTYPKGMKKVTCSVCTKKIPIYAKYCPFCGKSDKAIVPIGITTVVLCLLLLAGLIIPLLVEGGKNENKSEERAQTYSERVAADAAERERLKQESETAIYRKLTVDDLYEQFDVLQVGDWIEVTGVVSEVERGIALSELVCINLTAENKDCAVKLQAYSGELGTDFYENCEKGQVVTVKANVDVLYPHINRITAVYFEYDVID